MLIVLTQNNLRLLQSKSYQFPHTCFSCFAMLHVLYALNIFCMECPLSRYHLMSLIRFWLNICGSYLWKPIQNLSNLSIDGKRNHNWCWKIQTYSFVSNSIPSQMFFLPNNCWCLPKKINQLQLVNNLGSVPLKMMSVLSL